MRTRIMPLFSAVACCFLLLLLASSAALGAEKRAPLLQEGKKTLFQRVVVHPGTTMTAEANAKSAVVQQTVKPFTVFYVYNRKDGFLEVGPSTTAAQGWIEAGKATDWPQAMTLLFTERTGRMPVLFFKEQNGIEQICKAADLKEQLK